jgi:hypothetical protein
MAAGGVVAATLTSVSPASAIMRIADDRGGLVIAYTERFEAARASGEPVVIDGACLSACTLAIAILPRRQVCVTSNAILGFHAAWQPRAKGGRETSKVATRAMYEVYPTKVRSWIARHGGLSEELILLKGRELAAMIPTCGLPVFDGAKSVTRKKTRRLAPPDNS